MLELPTLPPHDEDKGSEQQHNNPRRESQMADKPLDADRVTTTNSIAYPLHSLTMTKPAKLAR